MTDYTRFFSENTFFLKLKELSGKVLESALLLYLVMSDKETPLGVRLAIVGALGYLVCPLDAIPDFLPGVGYSDDLAVLAALLASLDCYITDEMRQTAKDMLS